MQYRAQDIFKMKQLSTLIACVLLLGVHAQEYKIKYATDLSRQFRYTESLPVWEELATKTMKSTSPDWNFLRNTVEAAYMSENYRKATTWSALLTSKGKSEVTDWIRYMNSLCYMGQTQRVAGVLDTALLKFASDTALLARKSGLESFNQHLSNTSEHVIRMYKKGSKGEEFGAFPYDKGGILFVTNEYNSKAINKQYPRTGQFYTDIAWYDSTKNVKEFKFYQKPFWTNFLYKNRWRDIEQTKSHDGPISFNPARDLMFITSNFEEKDIEGKMKYARLKQRVFKVDGSAFTEFEFPFNSIQYSTGHASMDAKGTVYFVSNRPGSMIKSITGKDTTYSSDIWKTTFNAENDEWSEPVNLGPTVNTSEDEMFPFISNWGVLYFSSYGWNSIGGLDVFMSELDGNTPEHIGAPLNSNADDFAYYVDEETGKGYFSSNREQFKDRIYAFNKPVFKADLMVELKDCKGKVLKNQTIKIKDLKNEELIELTTDKNGKTEALDLRKNHEYKIWFMGDKNLTPDSASFKATMPISDVVSLSTYFKQYTTSLKVLDQNKNPLSDVRLNIYKHNGTVQKLNTTMSGTYAWKNEGAERVDSIVANLINHEDASIIIPATVSGNCVDTVNYTLTLLDKQDSEYIRLDLVLYNFDKYFLRPEGKVELDKLVKYMKSHQDLKVELSSHTDSRGSDKYNMKLSKQRAQSCVDYIVAQGISKKLIAAKGYGETMLLNKCKNGVWCSVDDHQMNRRTELKLITPEEQELDNNKLGN